MGDNIYIVIKKLLKRRKEILIMKLMKKVWTAKNKLSQRLYLFTAVVMSALCAAPVPKAFAANKSGKQLVDDLLKEKGNGAFDGATKVTKDVGGSIYVLMRNCGAACLILSIAGLGLGLAVHAGNPQKGAESKDHGINIVMGGCIVFGAISLLAMVVGIAGSI